ncbi:helix-turn-helix transcriptional regulator [Roseivirga echinicomitans]
MELKFPNKNRIQLYLEDYDIKVSLKSVERDIDYLRYSLYLFAEYDKKNNGFYFRQEDLEAASGALRFLEIAYLADNLSETEFAKYISYGDADLLKGIAYVPLLLDSIHNKKVIRFKHENYQKGTITETSLRPYLIREYLNRWYVIGYKTNSNELRTYGVDRISELKQTNEKFEKTQQQDVKSLFDHVIGVVYDPEKLIQPTFKVPLSQKRYMDSLPLHKSQAHLFDEDGYAHYQMEVVHNYELEQKLLMHSIFLTVTGPDHFLAYMAEKIKEINLRYERQILS